MNSKDGCACHFNMMIFSVMSRYVHLPYFIFTICFVCFLLMIFFFFLFVFFIWSVHFSVKRFIDLLSHPSSVSRVLSLVIQSCRSLVSSLFSVQCRQSLSSSGQWLLCKHNYYYTITWHQTRN